MHATNVVSGQVCFHPMESLLVMCAANALIANILTTYSTMAESLNANIELFPSSSIPCSNYPHRLW